ncbi:MAG: hypothetical protein K6F37_08095 [Lachnospiraceae bacterium]|nr:hypothetical protein [Lachnospiraceae bacterium]
MFGDKKKKIEELERKVSACEKRIADSAQHVDGKIAELKENREKMDGILNSIVDTTKTNSDIGEKIKTAVSNLSELDKDNDALKEYSEDVNAAFEKASEGIEQVEKNFETIEGPKSDLKKAKENLASSMRTVSSKLDSLKNESHQMAVIALNAGIEAGKLGAEGRGFLTAAEQIRSTGESYENKLADVAQELTSAMKKIEQMELFISSTEDILMGIKNDLSALKTDFKQPESDKYFDSDRDSGKTNALREINESIDDLKYNVDTVLGDMESLGECFVKMQETEDGLKIQES